MPPFKVLTNIYSMYKLKYERDVKMTWLKVFLQIDHTLHYMYISTRVDSITNGYEYVYISFY